MWLVYRALADEGATLDALGEVGTMYLYDGGAVFVMMYHQMDTAFLASLHAICCSLRDLLCLRRGHCTTVTSIAFGKSSELGMVGTCQLICVYVLVQITNTR